MMQRIGIICAMAALVGTGALMAQTQPKTAGQSGTAATANNQQGGSTLASGTAINAELSSTIDSKKAKPGDEVKAKITEAVQANGQQVLPRGTQLIGHVTEASARSKGENESALGIAFDKAVLKHGEEIPLSATIQAIATGAPPMNNGGGAPMDMGPSGSMGAPSGGGMSGGGRSPSTAPSTGGTPNSGGNVPNYPTATANDTGQPNGTNAGANGGLDSSGHLTPNSRGVFGLDGLTLNIPKGNNPQGSVIASTGKNVRLDSGTKMLLVTQPAASTQRPAK